MTPRSLRSRPGGEASAPGQPGGIDSTTPTALLAAPEAGRPGQSGGTDGDLTILFPGQGSRAVS
jgi:hypothetical protein